MVLKFTVMELIIQINGMDSLTKGMNFLMARITM